MSIECRVKEIIPLGTHEMYIAEVVNVIADDKYIDPETGKFELAINGIVDSYSERLYWHVRRFVCSHEDTNDLLQDIFIKIWSSLPSFRGDAKIYTWLYRIATNETLNYLRKIKRENAISIDEVGIVLATGCYMVIRNCLTAPLDLRSCFITGSNTLL